MIINVNIPTKKVLRNIEAMTSAIGRKNPSIDFETIWASEGDGATLSVYFNEAVNDLESNLKKWVNSTNAAVYLMPHDTYNLDLNVNDNFPKKLEILVKNKVAEYLAHATLAGWLSAYVGDVTFETYGNIAKEDIKTIISIITEQKLTRTEEERQDDDDENEDSSFQTTQRNSEDVVRQDENIQTTQRNSEDVVRQDENIQTTQRNSEDVTCMADSKETAGLRHNDNTHSEEESMCRYGARHNGRDRMRVDIRHEELDLGGTGHPLMIKGRHRY